MKRKIMEQIQNQKFKVVRVSKTEFELDTGDVYSFWEPESPNASALG